MDIYRNAVMSLSPKAYWRMNEKVKSDGILDASGNKYHGTYEGGVSFLEDKLVRGSTGFSAEFDGVEGTGGVVTGGPAVTTRSFAAWINRNDDSVRYIISVGSTLGYMRVNTTGRIQFVWRDGTNTARTLTSPTNVADAGETVFVVGVLDSNGDAFLYVDGVLVASDTSFTGITTTGTTWQIARLSATVNSFNGRIDELALFDYALSAAEVDFLWRAKGAYVSGVHTNTRYASRIL